MLLLDSSEDRGAKVILDGGWQKRGSGRTNNSMSVRYGLWYSLPPYNTMALAEGYTRKNDVCKTDNYHGFLFVKEGNTKAMPIYDLDGNLAGIQSAIPSNMKGFNSLNNTIDLPPVEIMPPVLKGLRDEKGMLQYTVTAYFKHPKLICSPLVPKGVSPGRGLYIQMGFNPENDFLHIPKDSKHLTPLWQKGPCLAQMGTHYFMNMSEHLPCEKMYPLFLMYDSDGKLGAFGWVFQGKPHNIYSEDSMGWFRLSPDTYPFLYDKRMLPACMFSSNFHIFGIRVYLKRSTDLVCTTKQMNYKQTTTERPNALSPFMTSIDGDKNKDNYAIDAFNNKSRASTITTLCDSLCLFVLLHSICVLFVKRNFH